MIYLREIHSKLMIGIFDKITREDPTQLDGKALYIGEIEWSEYEKSEEKLVENLDNSPEKLWIFQGELFKKNKRCSFKFQKKETIFSVKKRKDYKLNSF